MNELDIFADALELQAPEERARYLEQVCGADEHLRQRIDELLTAHAHTGAFMTSPAADGIAPAAVSEGPGTLIGTYKLLEQIGEGGFAVVFMAEQTQPVRRKVALKVLKPGMDTRQVVARFEAERQALAIMDHPNIAQVFDGGQTASGRPFFVMELVRGIPITEFCDSRHLPVRRRLELFMNVCHAVQHAHQKGIIHRDLKPSNVLVTLHDDRAVVKVIDFGIAKALGQPLTDKTLFTNFAQMIGTPIYMSPEQAQLSGLDVDTRSDIYSLGVLLYELLTGTTPFTKEQLGKAPYDEICRIIREEEPPKPSTRLSTLGQAALTVSADRQSDPARLHQLFRGELDWIVLKALEKDRNRRYETANALAMDLQRYLADEPVVACPPSKLYRLRKLVRRNKGPVVAASLVLLALVGGMIGTTWSTIRATNAEASVRDEARQKEHALAAAQQNERDAKDQLFLALWNQARAGRFSRQMGQRLDSLAALAKAAEIRPDERLRDEAIAALALPDVRRVPGWHTSSIESDTVAYGAHYRLYAGADSKGKICIRSIPDDREIRSLQAAPLLGSYLHFSPDDRFLVALEESRRFRIWRVEDGQPGLHDEVSGCRAHVFSGDGRRLAVAKQDAIVCFDLATGFEIKRWPVSAPVQSMAFHPDAGKLAVGFLNPHALTVFDAATGEILRELPVGPVAGQIVAWQPGGECVAIGGSDGRIQIWDIADSRRLTVLEGHAQNISTLAFHPHEDLLASHGWDGQLLLWEASSGRQLMRLTSVSPPHFSPDGRLLGLTWQGDQIDLLHYTPSAEYRTLVSSAGPRRGGIGYGDISADGRLLVVGMDDGARIWNLQSGREITKLPAGTSYAFFDGGAVGPTSSAGGLLTGGSAGLQRWPVAEFDPAGTRLRFGPPRQLSRLPHAFFARTPDGHTLAAATDEGRANALIDLQTGAAPRNLGSHPNGEIRALSGDGRWAASSGWHSELVRLWNLASGKMVHEWVVGKQTHVAFTPDSRTLIICRGDGFSFWDVESLQLVRRLPRDITHYPGWPAFSPDGTMMALEMSPGIIHLMEASTGRTIAKLEDPHGDRATWQGFTPDGAQLVVVAKYASAVHIWNLQSLRAQLKAMKLDW